MYDIAAKNFPPLEIAIDKLNRRAGRLGCEPIKVTILRRYEKEMKNTFGLTYMQARMEIEVEGESPCLEGWRLIAVIEKQANGENLVRTVPGRIAPKSYRTTDTSCDHCNTKRYRKEVFVLEHEDGTTVQVGRSCIKDFLGHPDAALLAARAEYPLLANELAKEAVFERSYGGTPCVDISEFLGMVAICIRRFGWVSRAKAEEECRVATANLAWELIVMRDDRRVRDFIASYKVLAEERDTTLAADALVWGRSLDGLSDYLYNLGVVCRQDYVDSKVIGFVASLIPSYQRENERREANKRKAATRKHVGTVGKREEFDVTVKRLRYFDSAWGVRTMCLFEDKNGNFLMWWASKELDISEGDTLKVKGTVTEHVYYNEIPQTTIKRCKIVQ